MNIARRAGAGPRRGLAAAICIWPVAVLAGAITDGSVGPVQSLSGHFVVPQTLGTVKGGNLFQSFASFGIASGESATFTTTSTSIRNVISRVTGGQPSPIYGPLTLQAAVGSRPDFFFINPAGVLFGAGAQIDVPGGFHVSTAQQLKFADGFVWDTGSPTVSGLTVAAPEAFGFLGRDAAVRFTNLDAGGVAGASPWMNLTAGSSLTVAAGTIEFEGTWLSLPSMTIQLAATGAGAVDVPLALSVGELAKPLGGAIRLSNSALSMEAPGVVALRGNSIDLWQSWIGLTNYGLPADGGPGAIYLRAAGDLSIRQSSISSETYCDVPGALISVTAGTLSLDGVGGLVSSTQMGKGTAGAIHVDVRGAMRLANRAVIDSTSYLADGDAGPVRVSAGSLAIDGDGSAIRSVAYFSGGSAGTVTVAVDNDVALTNGGGISSVAIGGRGSGAVTVTVGGAMTLSNGANIDSDVQYSTGNSGPVSITADSLRIDGAGIPDTFAGIDSSTLESTGNAGPIDVHIKHAVSLVNGGRIQSGTLNGGDAGTIVVNAQELTIVGSPEVATAITTNTASGNGDAGAVTVIADRVFIAQAGQIASSTGSNGAGGAVTLRVGTMTIDGSGFDGGTGVTASAMAGSSGQTGQLTVSATGPVTLRNRGTLRVRNDATVADPAALHPTTLSVSAASLLLDNAEISAASTHNGSASNIDITTGDRLTLKSSSIRTSAVDGDGGSIRLAGNLIRLTNSLVTTSVEGQTNGNGGNIDITGNALVLKSGFIQANTLAPLARGGNININTRLLIPEGGRLVLGGARVPFGSGYAGLNVIQAAAPDGIGGDLQITTPELNLAGTLSGLATPVLDFGPMARDQCRTGAGSSFTLMGSGALPASVADLGLFGQ